MNNDNIPEEFDYDDGVVSFGTLTENQIERFKRLPRHTVLPSDIQLSQSFLDTDRDEHDESNDCTTQLTNNLAKENEASTIELKQSSVDESSSFSSPSAVKFFPSTKLLDTDVVNRYIHKKSMSSDESLSEYQNTTAIEDESLSYLNDQESVVTLANYTHESLSYLNNQESVVTLTNSAHNETEDCEQLSVLNEIDQSQIQKKIPDNANNICTLKPCSLNGEDEEEDISICNETELVNTSNSSEDSIIVEKYSVTPGKQRLYDVRHTKPAFHAKFLGTAAPFMDRIEETVTSVPRLHNTSLVLSTSPNLSVMEINFNDEPYANELSTNNDDMHLNKSLNDTNQISEVINATEHNFGTKESMKNVSEISVKMSDLSDYHDGESIAVDIEITSTNTSVMDTNFDDKLSINKLSTNNDGMNLNKSLNETANQTEEIMDASEYNFDVTESMNNVSEISVKMSDSTDNIHEEIVPANLEITSTNTSVNETTFVDELSITKLSTNNDSMNFNKSLNETANQPEEIMDMDASKYNFDITESMNNVSEISVKMSDSTDNIHEETVPANLEIASTNTSVKETNFVDELSINKLSTNNDSMNFNKSLNETANQTEEIMDASKYNFDITESMNNVSEISVKMSDSTDNIHEETVPANFEITSTNTSVMDTKFDDKLYTNKLSTNDNGLICIELYNTEDQDTESNIDIDKSLNNIHNINGNETSQSCELNNSALKNLINIDISYAEEKNLTHSSEISVINNGTPQNSSCAMKFLEFEETVYEMCNPKLNNSTINDSQTHRNILLTEQTAETYVNDLSIIIENRTLEENSNDLVMQNEEFENPINAVLENSVNENLDNIVFNELATLNNKESFVAKDTLLPEVLKLSIVNKMENNTSERVMKSNEDIFIEDSNIDSIFVDNKVISSDEKINESCSISNNKFLKAESNVLLNKEIQSLELLGETRNINNCVNEFINMEQMFNFGENQKVQMLNLDTPKTQKILDFSIVPQTPTVESHAKKQKLLNFSIVDQTPISKDTQQKFLNNSFTENNLSGMNKILELESDSFDKDCQNCINNASSKNISTISAPDTESFIDVSINSDSSIINQTLTETNLNNTTHSIPELVKSVTNCASNITFNQNSKKLDCSTILMDLNEKIIKSNKNAIVDFSIIEQPIPHTFKINNDTNITFVESKTNVANLIDSSVVSMTDVKSKGHVFDSSQNPIIVISSDIETEKSLTSTLDYCSVNDSTTHLEQSTFSHSSELLTDVQMNDLSLSIESEKSSVSESFHSIELDHVKEDKKRKLEPIQDYHNFEKIMKVEAKDPELDHVQEDSKNKIEHVQVNCNSENKMKVESKDTESDHVHEDNKRKIKPVHDFHNSEKKMKMESEEPKTPISMLYKIKNMFKSNEKLPQYKNTTKSENRFNFNKVKDDKPEVLVKSKIPYKVTNTPKAQNDEFNNSKSLNDNKSKKGIPKFVGLPALSDLSNKTFPGQNSKFQ